MKKVSGSLKLLYSQFRELQAFAQFGSDLDADTKERLALGERIVEILKQDKNAPVPVEYQVAIIFAATNGYLNDIKTSDIGDYEKEMNSYLKNTNDEFMDKIRETGVLSDEDTAKLKSELAIFTSKYKKEKYGIISEE